MPGGETVVGNDVQKLEGTDSRLTTGDLRLIIKDNGIGIPPEKLPHIFDRFYQADDAATRRAEGTGIGLTLTRELVKLMGGNISVKSTVGEGTEFTILLPISNQAQRRAVAGISRTAPMPYSIPPIAAVTNTDLDRGRRNNLPLVLLIEDNRDVVHYLTSCLEGAYRLAIAANGQEGIRKALELIPDLIISDVMMPEKDGFEVTQTLKSDRRTSHIPIILLTAKADIASRLEGLERGADAYLPKPFHKSELLVRLRKLLELRQQLRQYYLGLAAESQAPDDTPPAVAAEPSEHEFVQKVRSCVEAHLDDPEFTVAVLCRKLAMSHSQFHRKITALTGLSANRFIRYIRLSAAKSLLRGSELNITEVAYASGFSDPVYFTRVFRKEFGLTPSEFRERGGL